MTTGIDTCPDQEVQNDRGHLTCHADEAALGLKSRYNPVLVLWVDPSKTILIIHLSRTAPGSVLPETLTTVKVFRQGSFLLSLVHIGCAGDKSELYVYWAKMMIGTGKQITKPEHRRRDLFEGRVALRIPSWQS